MTPSETFAVTSRLIEGVICQNQKPTGCNSVPEHQQFLPEFETASIVHAENVNGRASGGRQSLNLCTPE